MLCCGVVTVFTQMYSKEGTESKAENHESAVCLDAGGFKMTMDPEEQEFNVMVIK